MGFMGFSRSPRDDNDTFEHNCPYCGCLCDKSFISLAGMEHGSSCLEDETCSDCESVYFLECHIAMDGTVDVKVTTDDTEWTP